MNILVNLVTLKAQIELNSISMSKNDPKITDLDKYDVEANIDEVENTDEQSVFKYGFTALSNPKNVRLSIEGVARIFGDSMERNEILDKDENDVPKILTMIYQELFPTFFLLSKTLNVSCPPHTIGKIGETLSREIPESITDGATENELAETIPDSKIDEDTENEIVEPLSDSNSDLESKPESSPDKVELETPNASQQ